jgi:glycosyltransferase involved in cell wall biosynthesis
VPVDGRPAPRVSAVVPTYNRAPLVTRAIESVLRQTFRDLELIVVDDASPDDTPSAVARFDDPRLRYIRLPKNKGQWFAENTGIAYARGEWVAFLDDDDEWLPDKLDKQLACAERARAAVVYCEALRYSRDGLQPPGPLEPLPDGNVLTSLLSPLMPSTPTVYMVRRDALLALGGFDESLAGAQDRDLWIRLSMASYHFAQVQERLAIYHTGHTGRQMLDAVRIVRSTFVHRRRWGRLKREAMGVEGYETWLRRREKLSRREIEKLVRSIERSGSRSAAWRYVRRMTPVWPWGAAFYSRMLAVVAFGRLPYRVSRVRQGKSGAPWLRRLFGAG